MTLEEINFISQIVGSIAVIASLIYIGWGIRLNTIATQSHAAQAYVAADNETVGLINTSDNLADILHRGAVDMSALQVGDLIQFMAFLDQLFISFQSSYLQWKKGALDERLWNTYKLAIVDLLAQPGQQEWWGLRRRWFFDEFRDYVDQTVASVEGKLMHPGALAG